MPKGEWKHRHTCQCFIFVLLFNFRVNRQGRLSKITPFSIEEKEAKEQKFIEYLKHKGDLDWAYRLQNFQFVISPVDTCHLRDGNLTFKFLPPWIVGFTFLYSQCFDDSTKFLSNQTLYDGILVKWKVSLAAGHQRCHIWDGNCHKDYNRAQKCAQLTCI